mgnify:CR=1 FL=1
MKTNISIDLNDEQRSRLHDIVYSKKSGKLISRKELNSLVQLMIQEVLEPSVKNHSEVTNNISESGWSYYFNNKRVTQEEYNLGIHAWIKKKENG